MKTDEQKIKDQLIKKLEELRINKINDFTFDFKGVCNKPHRINTNPENYKIKPGTFFHRIYYKSIESENENSEIILIVGIGKECSRKKKKIPAIWYLREDDMRGLFCTNGGTPEELNQLPSKLGWEIV